MTDNFERYKDLIRLTGGLPLDNNLNDLDKYYVIELIRRGKDNPDLSAANYHFRNYYIYSWKDLDRYEQEIKSICDLLNLRAYCSVNYKMMSQVALDTLAESARRIASHDYRKFYTIFESCSGRYVDRGNSMWIVDVDEVKFEDVKPLIDYINNMESGHNPNVIYYMPTRSGVHLITHPFNLQQFNDEWNEHFQKMYGEIPGVQKNHITLLYENL